MPHRHTLESFIKRAIEVHGDKYDYSKVVYINTKTPINIVCPIHGVFNQTPNQHLDGCGCKKCGIERRKGVIYGIGINDYDGSVFINGSALKSYSAWRDMIKRCYCESDLCKSPSYINCYICESWKFYSNFKKWFEDELNGYHDGYNLDKDILVKGNKVYSPTTCCFVPQEINKLLTKHDRRRGKYPIGVTSIKDGIYSAQIHKYGKRIGLGKYNSIKEAFNVYKNEKEKYIQEVAQEYYDKGLITKRVYDALMNYKVEITD